MEPWNEYQRTQYLDAESRHRYTRYSREDSTYEEWCEVVLDMPFEFWTYCKQQEGGNAQAFLLRLIHVHRVREVGKESAESVLSGGPVPRA